MLKDVKIDINLYRVQQERDVEVERGYRFEDNKVKLQKNRIKHAKDEYEKQELEKALSKMEESLKNARLKIPASVSVLNEIGKRLESSKEETSIPTSQFIALVVKRLDRKLYKMQHSWKKQVVYTTYLDEKKNVLCKGFVCITNAPKNAPDTVKVDSLSKFFEVQPDKTPSHILVEPFFNRQEEELLKETGKVNIVNLAITRRRMPKDLPTFNITSLDSVNPYATYYEDLYQEHLQKDIWEALEQNVEKTK